MEDTETGPHDLIVVGAGLAGLTAALRGAELGLRTLVLEQGDGKDYPCNSRQSGGILHIGFHDPFRPAAELRDLIARMTDGEAQAELSDALASNGSRLISWLQDKGARFMRFNQLEGYRWCLAPPRALRAGIDWQNRGPDVVLRLLVEQLTQRGGALRLGTRVTSLVMDGERCVGVRAERDGRQEVWRAPNCLIADGGFQSHRALFEKNIGPDFDAVFQRGARTGKGAGLEMAVAAGAATTATNRFYGHLLCRDALTNDNVWPYPELDAIATAGVVVDGHGDRIADEGRTGVYLANALATHPSSARFHAIFDGAIWDGPGTSARIPANPLLEKAGGTVHRADTLEDLASMIGVPPDRLRATVEGYNGALSSGTLGELPVPRSQRIQPHPVGAPPFMAIALLPGITYTMGGIATDGKARVLDRTGRAIPGLLAAGSATGGLEGGENAVYIGGLIKAGTFGLIAAETVAQQGRAPADAEEGAPDRHPAPAREKAAPAMAAAAAPPAPASVPAAAAPKGLARYPMLGGALRHGKTIAVLGALLGASLTGWLAWGALGPAALVPSAVVGAVVAAAILSYVELVRLITEMLIPD